MTTHNPDLICSCGFIVSFSDARTLLIQRWGRGNCGHVHAEWKQSNLSSASRSCVCYLTDAVGAVQRSVDSCGVIGCAPDGLGRSSGKDELDLGQRTREVSRSVGPPTGSITWWIHEHTCRPLLQHPYPNHEA